MVWFTEYSIIRLLPTGFFTILNGIFSNFLCSIIIEQMGEKSCKKVANNYNCEICDYNTSRKSCLNKHLLTAKHLNRTNLNKLEHVKLHSTFFCEICNKSYNARNSLWYHKQKCNLKKDISINNIDKNGIKIVKKIAQEVVIEK